MTSFGDNVNRRMARIEARRRACSMARHVLADAVGLLALVAFLAAVVLLVVGLTPTPGEVRQ
jgi:hypothetical protein